MDRRVALVSGGTGGHLLPALVLARALREQQFGVVLFGEGREVERELLQRELPGLAEVRLPGGAVASFGLPRWLCRSMALARQELRRQQIDCVISTGGRPSVPVGLAAASLRLPLFLLEQNAVTGRANRWLLPLAARIYHGLPLAGRPPGAGLGRRGLLTGTPVRSEFGRIDRDRARRELGLAPELPVVLVTGGSQGAKVLNELAPAVLLELAMPLQVIHLAGVGKDDAVRQVYAADASGRVRAVVRPVAPDMHRLFAAADLVLCRGGGTTVAELAAAGRAAVIVPYPHHKDRQQLRNAEVLAAVGAAAIREERQLDRPWLRDCLRQLLPDAARLRTMEQAASSLRPQDPVQTILQDLAAVLRWPLPWLPGPSPVGPGSSVATADSMTVPARQAAASARGIA